MQLSRLLFSNDVLVELGSATYPDVEDTSIAVSDVVRLTRARVLLAGDIVTLQDTETRWVSDMINVSRPIENIVSMLVHKVRWGRTNMRFILCLARIVVECNKWFTDTVAARNERENKEIECTICWEPVNGYRNRGFYPCGHCCFHKKCQVKWNEISGSCPICRKTL
ncbi:ring finger domain containing protein [Nitzschia inconspicua]|uniref:Ring finger domain containing protein n=1 Tax=Nitzschia inconspicua TaxID=303405 RepID=A0A9K3PRU2_9STRA|nr:ring finger domain containing protein [Nitzschia inconspicua]